MFDEYNNYVRDTTLQLIKKNPYYKYRNFINYQKINVYLIKTYTLNVLHCQLKVSNVLFDEHLYTFQYNVHFSFINNKSFIEHHNLDIQALNFYCSYLCT